MKNILVKSLIVLVGLTLATSCIEEVLPQGGSQNAEQVSKNESAIAAILNSLPSSMMTSNAMGYAIHYEDHTDFGISSVYMRLEHMLEDIATQSKQPGYNRFFAYDMCQAQGSDYIYCAYFWDCYYAWIKTTNDVIRLIPEDTEDPIMKTMLGQAYAYRGMIYLDLARIFEAKEINPQYKMSEATKKVLGLTIPKITETSTEDDAKFNPRMPREEAYDFILSDLTKAESILKGLKIDYTMPSESAVYMLKARAYIEMAACQDEGAAAKALEYAQKVIDISGKTPLTQLQWEDPANGFNNGKANNAWIWGLTSSSENQLDIITFTSHMCTENNWGYALLSQIGINKALYDKIPDHDFRKHSWIDPKMQDFYKYKLAGTPKNQADFWTGDGDQRPPVLPYQSIKFRPAGGECENSTSGNVTDFCLMRIEEAYYIKAEAQARLGRLSDAAKTLEEIVNTRYNQNVGRYSCTSQAMALPTFLEEMLTQKRIEFWGEGILFFDYKRLNHGITRAYPGSNHASMFALNCEGRSPQWNVVITRAEFQSNTAITDDTNNPDPSEFTTPETF